jgi:hypothetical protein
MFAAKGHRQWWHLRQNIGRCLAQELEAHWHFTGMTTTTTTTTTIAIMPIIAMTIQRPQNNA